MTDKPWPHKTPHVERCAVHGTFPVSDEPCWACEREANGRRSQLSMGTSCPSCGRAFARAEWQSLPFLGVAFVAADEGEERAEESRSCPSCGSAIARTLATATVMSEYVRRALNDGRSLFEALRAVQARCTELKEEVRRLRAPLAPLTPSEEDAALEEITAQWADDIAYAVTVEGPASQVTIARLIAKAYLDGQHAERR